MYSLYINLEWFKTDRHGLNKKLIRGAHQIKQVTGLTTQMTVDETFDALYDRFEKCQRFLTALKEQIQRVVYAVRGLL